MKKFKIKSALMPIGKDRKEYDWFVGWPGIIGYAKALGKDSKSDVKNNKLTYVSVYGLETAVKNAEKLIEKSINKIIDLAGNLNKKSLLEICNFIISRDC